MGDLKKKNIHYDYMVRTKDGKDIMIEQFGDISEDEKSISKLQDYIQLFYEQQVEKAKKGEKNKDE